MKRFAIFSLRVARVIWELRTPRAPQGEGISFAVGQCGIGRWFKRCQNQAENVCQYCGRDFCRDHRYFVQGHEAICNQKYCVAKHEDLKVYLQYRQDVEKRNRSGICGHPDCEIRIGAGCSLCSGQFCELHVSQRRHTIRDDRGLVERWIAVCPVCWERRKIWSRIK